MLCRATFWKVSQIQWQGEPVNWTSVMNEQPPSLVGFRRSTLSQKYYVFHDLFKVGGEAVIKGCQRKQRGARQPVRAHEVKEMGYFHVLTNPPTMRCSPLLRVQGLPHGRAQRGIRMRRLGQTWWPLFKAAKPPGSLLIQAIPPITRRRRTSVRKGGAWTSLRK